ncbi:MAG TPA: hypothetical protein VII22_06250, partial [Streptosporangiaceae bacterium]|jgi:hypothetical protein
VGTIPFDALGAPGWNPRRQQEARPGRPDGPARPDGPGGPARTGWSAGDGAARQNGPGRGAGV